MASHQNIMEKIGDLLFIHGGVSAEMNALDISLAGINKLTRPYYPDSTYKFPDHKLDTIFGDSGPFWYRGYYRGAVRATPHQIDSTLTKFGNKFIITGHTIVGDTVSVRYEGRVFNTDVHHVEGKSEALLVEGKKFYRADAHGNKVLLLARD